MKPNLHFIHNARTGGNFIKNNVIKNSVIPRPDQAYGRVMLPGMELVNGQMFSSLGHINMQGILIEKYYQTFTVVRHPLTRFLSCYSFNKNKRIGCTNRDLIMMLKSSEDIKDFIDMVKYNGIAKTLKTDQMFRTQESANKPFNEIHIIKYENLVPETDAFLKSINLKLFTTEKVNSVPTIEADEEIKRFVELAYKEDYKTYGYDY